MKRTFIARADDFGSAQAANAAILEALTQGCLICNVSCMAPGPHIARDAEALRAFAARVDLGLHLTVNSEWDTVAWTPCGPPVAAAPLLDRRGRFYQTGEALAAAAPPVEAVLREASAQLDRLTGLGLPITYLDGHMFPYRFLPGLDAALRQWCREKGLLYAAPFDRFYAGGPAFGPTYAAFSQATDRWLRALAAPVTLYIIHPAKLSHETCAFSNGSFPPGVVAWERELEYRSALDAAWHARLASLTPVRFRDLAQEE